jgi:hypothetical protein
MESELIQETEIQQEIIMISDALENEALTTVERTYLTEILQELIKVKNGIQYSSSGDR